MAKLRRLSSVHQRLKPISQRLAHPVEQADRGYAWRAWYKTKRWQQLRRSVLERDGYVCQQTGVLLVGKYPSPNSAVADHITPHRGDPILFWDANNLQAVSKAYHDSEKQRLENARGGGSKV